MSTISGIYFAVNIFLSAVLLGVSAVGKSASVTFAVFGVFQVLWCGRILWSQTLQSRTFKNVKKHLLNDANLIPVIHEIFQRRFELWWEAHEISASQLFGIKMTTHRVARALVGLGSVVIIVAGLLVREALGMGGLMH